MNSFKHLFFLISFALASPGQVNAEAVNWTGSITGYIVNDEDGEIAAPASVTLLRNGQQNQLSWQANAADSYRIQQAQDGGSWQTIDQVTGTSVTLNAPLNHRYRYRLAACLGEGIMADCSMWTPATEIVGELAPPTNLSVVVTPGKAIIEITPLTDYFTAPVYRLEYMNDAGNWLTYDQISGSSFEFYPPGTGNYQFRVLSCIDTENTASETANDNLNELCSTPALFSQSVALTPKPDAPELKLKHGQYNAINIFWDEVQYASYYRYDVSDNGRSIYNKTTSDLSVVFYDSLPRGNLLTFKVMACADASHCSPYSNTRATTPLLWSTPKTPQADSRHGSQNAITFFWDEIYDQYENIDYYDVLITKETSDGEVIWQQDKLTQTSLSAEIPLADFAVTTENNTKTFTLSFYDTLPRGDWLVFQVRACTNEGKCSSYNDQSREIPFLWGRPNRPQNADIDTLSMNEINLFWDAPDSFFEFYRVLVTDNGTPVFETTLIENKIFFDDILPGGNPLLFQVQACNNEEQCSDYVTTDNGGDPLITTPGLWHDSPLPRPWMLAVDNNPITQGDDIHISWQMHESHTVSAENYSYSLNLTQSGNPVAQIVDRQKINELVYSFNHPVGEYQLEVQACNEEKGCGQVKPITVTVVERDFIPKATLDGTSITLLWGSLPAGTASVRVFVNFDNNGWTDVTESPSRVEFSDGKIVFGNLNPGSRVFRIEAYDENAVLIKRSANSDAVVIQKPEIIITTELLGSPVKP